MLSKKKLKKVFKMLDKDKSGSISLREIKDSLSTVKRGGEDFFNSLIAVAGFNEAKEINFEEFNYLVTQANHKPKASNILSL